MGSNAGPQEKQDAFGPALRAKHLEQPDALRQLFTRKQHGEDGTTDGLRLPREAIERALEGTAHGVDALWRPGGQIGEGPRADLVPGTEGFTSENGRGGRAMGNGSDLHEYLYIINTFAT